MLTVALKMQFYTTRNLISLSCQNEEFSCPAPSTTSTALFSGIKLFQVNKMTQLRINSAQVELGPEPFPTSPQHSVAARAVPQLAAPPPASMQKPCMSITVV